MSYNFNNEKSNTVTSLKNEIYGISQIIDTLEKLERLDYEKLEKKVINKKLIKFFNENTKSYFSFKNEYMQATQNQIIFLVEERYNNITKSYISFYDRYQIAFDIITDNNFKKRFSSIEFLKNVKISIIALDKKIIQLENELENINEIVNEYEKIDKIVRDFKRNKSGFFSDSFKNLSQWY